MQIWVAYTSSIRWCNHITSISSTCTMFWSMNERAWFCFIFFTFVFRRFVLLTPLLLDAAYHVNFRVKYVQTAVNWLLKFMLYLIDCIIEWLSRPRLCVLSGCAGDIELLKCWEIEELTTTWIFLCCDCVDAHYLANCCSESEVLVVFVLIYRTKVMTTLRVLLNVSMSTTFSRYQP